MKVLISTMILLLSFNSVAEWDQEVNCDVKRTWVGDHQSVIGTISANFRVEGGHNSETGEVTLQSNLAPSYPMTLTLLSTGKTDSAELTTKLGEEIIAKSSVDLAMTDKISTVFLTKDIDYQVSVTCTLKNYK